MAYLVREIRINAPKNEVWAHLADFGNIYKFNPNVPTSYSTSDAKSGLGATRHCDLNMMNGSIEERIVDWKDGERYTIEIYDGQGTPPFKKVLATIELSEDKGQTVVTGTMDYALKFGPIGSLMDQVMIKKMYGRAWEGVLAGLKHYSETGEQVDSNQQLKQDFQAILAVA